MTRVVICVVVLLGLSVSLYGAQARLGRLRGRPVAGAQRALLSLANLTCDGVFLSPVITTGVSWASQSSLTMRKNGSARRYLALQAGDGHILEFNEASLSACNTAWASITQQNTVLQDWGQIADINSGAADGSPPGGVFVMALSYDPLIPCVIVSWTQTYGSFPTGNNSFSCQTFGVSSLNMYGCWGISSATPSPKTATGIVQIPSWFITNHLTAGQRWGVGLGGYISTVGSRNSFGPYMQAIAVPPTNLCPNLTNTYTGAGELLLEYGEQNDLGPSCDYGANGPPYFLDCDYSGRPPAVGAAPKDKYPARTSHIEYRTQGYGTDWNPFTWLGSVRGYHAAHNGASIATWYDDGVKHGIVYPMQSLQGWISQTVLASPAPTYTAGFFPSYTFSVGSTSTNDGLNLQVGDRIFVQTCTPLGAGCAKVTGENMLQFASTIVTAVNTGTGSITVDDVSHSVLNENYIPLVGGKVLGGAVYHAGGFGMMRMRLRLQSYAPADLGAVADGLKDSDDPEYVEDIYLDTIGPKQFGCDSGCDRVAVDAQPASGNPLSQVAYSGIMSDPDNRKLIISVWVGGHQRHAIFVFSVPQ